MHSTARVCITLIAAAAACTHPRGAPGPVDLAGTYAVTICRGPCRGLADDSVVGRGHLVMEATYLPSELPAAARRVLEGEEFLRMGDDDRVLDPNACFVFERIRSGSYAGIVGVGFTRADVGPGDTVGVDLFHTPDAGYYVILHRAGTDLRGRGHSWGVGAAAIDVPQDSVVARRVGPPDRAVCVRAAEAAVAAEKGHAVLP